MKISEAKRQVMLQQWTELIKEQKARGMKVNAWCKERGIGEGQFYYWQKQVRQTLLDSVSSPDGNGAALVKVDINSAPDEAPQRALLLIDETKCVRCYMCLKVCPFKMEKAV